MKGNATALKEVWERLDGKVLQTEKLQLGGTDGKQVTIEVVYAMTDGAFVAERVKEIQLDIFACGAKWQTSWRRVG